MVAGNTAEVPKEIVEALEALERLVIRYGTLPKDRALLAAEHLTRDFPGVTLELDKKPEDLAPPPETPRAPRPMRGGPRGDRGPRRPRRHEGDAPAPAPEGGAPAEPAAEGPSPEPEAAPAEAPAEKPAEKPAEPQA